MQVTDVRVRRVEKEGKMKAIVSGTREMIQTIILDKYESTLLENEEEALA